MQHILLLHGALGCSDDLNGLAAALRKLEIEPHCFSFSGHGKAPFAAEFSMAQFSHELETYIVHHGLAPACVFGYSMGGYVALHSACGRPHLFKGVVTLGTKFNWTVETAAKETRLLDPVVTQQKVPAFAALLEKKHGENWAQLMNQTASLLRGLGAAPPLSPEVLSQLPTRTWIGVADKDHLVSTEESLSVYRGLPDAGMYVLPNTKHALETADHTLLALLLAQFLQGLNATPTAAESRASQK